MKKVSFLFISFISILSGLLLLFGCNNGTRPSKNNSNNVDNNKKSYLSVSRVTVSGEKTAFPVFTNDTISDFVFTLQGKTADSDTEETLGTYEGLEALTSASIPVETGNWEFSLLAAKDGTAFTGTKEMEIITGNNTISFVLKWDEEALSGNGNLLFSLDFSKALNKLDVMLATGELIKYNSETKEETAIEAYKETPLDFTDYKVTYELTDLPADIYRIKIHLYADTKKKLPINTYPGLAIITGGQTSTEAKEMDSLNSVCFIKVEGATITGTIGSGASASKVFIQDRTVPIGDLWVCDHEVTQGEYETYCMYGDSDTTNRPSSTIGLGAHFPVYFVSWYDALVYCNLRSKTEKLTPVYKMKGSNGELTDDPTKWTGVVSNNLTGEEARYCGPSEDNTDWNNVVCDWSANGYRLPTDAEWEYIARGGNGLTGTQYTYAGSNTVDDVAWHYGNSSSKNHEIKGKNPSTLGLYDLSGNVWELCWDWYPDTSTETITATTNPYGISSGKERIKRGGSWTNNGSSYANVYNQNPNQPKDRVNHTGFRVVRNASFNPVIVKFDTTSNWPENTAQIDSVVIDKEGQTVSLPAYDGTRSGYTFKGWYTTATPGDSDEPFDFASPITDNITLYAVWEADFVLIEGTTVTGAVGSGESASQIFIEGRTVPIGDLYVCDHEVTQKEYEQFMTYYGAATTDTGTGQGGSSEPYKPNENIGLGDNIPAYYVSWYETIIYCNLRSAAEGLTPAYYLAGEDGKELKLGTDQNGRNVADWANSIQDITTDENGKYYYNSTGNYSDYFDYFDSGNGDLHGGIRLDLSADGYRLPTEAEWEYLARGGVNDTQYTYSGSENVQDVAWYEDNSQNKVHEIRGKQKNAFNLYDMSGNVFERCWDWGRRDTTLTPETPPTGDSLSRNKIARGGSWDQGAIHTSVYYRNNENPNKRFCNLGFRVVRNASFHPLLVTFDTTTNYPGNTAKVNYVVIDEAGKTVSLPDYDGTRSGYTFKGWYTSATPEASAEPFDFTSQITEDTTLYAVWNDFMLVEGMTVNSTNASSLAILNGRELTINDFYMCNHEVTQKEWTDVMGALPALIATHQQGIGNNYPVYYLDWYSTIVYCNKLSIRENLDCAYSLSGKDDSFWRNFTYPDDISSISTSDWNSVELDMSANGYRLPTEVEWEYAARGGKNLESYTFAGSDDYTKVAWARENAELTTHPVKTDKIEGIDSANSLGLYDMCGNVNEWVWDFYNTINTNTPITGPTAGSTIKRVKKGGGWDSVATSGETATIDRHSGTEPTQDVGSSSDHQDIGFGFRVVRKASTYPLLVKFDTTSNYSENTSKVDSILITGADKKVTEPSYSVKKNGYALKGWYTTANPTETDSPFNFDNSITESITLYAVWYAPASVGDVLLTDGSIISYKAGRTFTDTEKANAVGVLYGFDEEGAPMGWVAKYHTDTHTGYVWATNDVTLGGTGFEAIACTRTSESNNVDEGVTFEGDLDGSDNWEKVCEADTTAESNPEKYPVFDYVNKYGKDPTADYYFGGYLSETEYKDGWYLPSIAELACLFKNREKINDVLNALNEDGKPNTNTHYYSCWSSSLSQDASKCWVVTSNDWGETGYVDVINKNSYDSYRVIPVHK